MTRLLSNRYVLRAIYYPWIVLPYTARKLVTTAGIWTLLLVRRIKGIDRRREPTPPEKLFTLSFWGVPDLIPGDYTLAVDGGVRQPLGLSLYELKGLPRVERPVTLDCVGGSRNNCVMSGVSLAALLDRAQPEPDAQTAVFYCARRVLHQPPGAGPH